MGRPFLGRYNSQDSHITFFFLTLEDGQRDEAITTTPEHPFYVKEWSDKEKRPKPVGHEDLNEHWVGAGHLKIGDKLQKADGTTGTVKFVNTVQETRTMYNLEVAEAHTFFVGTQGWLVHNCDWELGLGRTVETTTTSKGTQKIDLLFANRNDAMVWAQKQLGLDIERVYDSTGKWTGWVNKSGDRVYWGHDDWGRGVGKSTFPHLNFEISGAKGHLFLEDKITNRGMMRDFKNTFRLK